MADQKISDLTAVSTPAAGSEVPVNESGTTKKMTVTQMKTLIRNAGTSFPGSPSTGDTYFRTDLGLEFFYDGTRWLSVTLFEMGDATPFANSGTWALALTATSASVQRAIAYENVGSDLWLEDVILLPFVNSGGTALGASHKWVATVNKVNTSNSATSLGTVSLDSGSSNVWRPLVLVVDALIGGAGYGHIRIDWTKTGTPGDLNITGGFKFTYRIVAT